MSRAAALGSCLLLCGCLGMGEKPPATESTVIATPVNKPTATTCVPASLGPTPAYPDTDQALRQAAGSAERFLQLLVAGRDLKDARLAALEPAIEGCRK